jgi:hypothetical protein
MRGSLAQPANIRMTGRGREPAKACQNVHDKAPFSKMN